MNRQRLEHLIKVLEAVPPAKFDMEIFGRAASASGVVTASCTTAACALGWAALDPEFQKQGLVPGDVTAGMLWAPICVAEGKDNKTFYSHGFWSADSFFELQPRERNFLFDPSTYAEDFGRCQDEAEFEPEEPEDSWDSFYPLIKPEHVIVRVRQLLASQGEGEAKTEL